MASNQRIRPFPLTYPDKILYQIVNLKETASQKEIDRAWIGLDPDSYDSEKMLDVVKAFWILRDSYRRRVYDNYGLVGVYIAENYNYRILLYYYALTDMLPKIVIINFMIVFLLACFMEIPYNYYNIFTISFSSFLSVISDSRLTNPDIDRTLLMGIANGLDYIKNKCKLNLDPSQQLDFKTLVTS